MKVQKKIVFAFIRLKLNYLVRTNPQRAGEVAFKLFSTPIKTKRKESRLFNHATSLILNFNGMEIKGSVFNAPQQKKVLILHGFSSNRKKFESFVEPLIKKNYEVIAFDAPAHGESEGKQINALEYSELIKLIIVKFGPIDSFIAHSFGGLAVCLALENIPHNAQTKLVLIAPATETTSAIDAAFKIAGIRNKQLKTALEQTIIAKSGQPASWYSIRRAMHQIKASTLWFHDDEDFTTPVEDALIVKNDNHPHIQFKISKGLGHSKIYRDDTVRAEIVDFL